MDYIYFVCYFAIFVVNNSYMQKILFAFIIFHSNLKRLLPSKTMGLLWWHQFDGLGMSMTSLTTPLQLSVFMFEWNAYFTTSNQFVVEKNKPCPQFSPFNILFLSEVHHNTEVKTVANFRFMRTLIKLFFFFFYKHYNIWKLTRGIRTTTHVDIRTTQISINYSNQTITVV